MPKNITIYLPDKTAKEMKKYHEVNWSEICRNAILDYLKTRESVSPKAAAKFSDLKKKERAEGFEFGARLAEELTNLLGYVKINQLLATWDFYQQDIPSGELGNIGTYFGFLDNFGYEGDFDLSLSAEAKVGIEKLKKEKGNVEWLIDFVSKKEGFHKSWVFVHGMFAALKEIFVKGRI
jgi:hypothetical protein